MSDTELQSNNIVRLPINQIHFDPQNPRFARYFGNQEQPEFAIIERMIKNENVQELMGSIGEQGYFVGEPLLVARVEDGYIVVEGNRRLAALKLLNGEYLEKQLPSITHLREATKIPPQLDVPCIVFASRCDILRYLGYRHISGAKRWDSLSKALYLKELLTTFFSELSPEDQLKGIAKEIGSKSTYVAQILTGLTVYQNAIKNNFYGLQRLDEDDIDFSVLTTALSRPAISEYIGLESPRDIPANNLNTERTRELFSWIFAQDTQGNTLLGESRNLGKLAAVVANPSSVLTLKETGNLDTAFLFSGGSTEAFAKVLRDADKKLRDVFKLTSDIKDFNEVHLKQIEDIIAIAEDIQYQVNRAIRRRKVTIND